MNGRYIFNSQNNYYAGTILKMAEAAAKEGYRFFLFNDRVYFTTEGKSIFETGLTDKDIFVIGCDLGGQHEGNV